VKKESLAIRAWLKNVAPGKELRTWYHHDPAKWDEFRRRYFSELLENPTSWLPLLEAARHGIANARHYRASPLNPSGTSDPNGKRGT
jgi:uncharacterized protein YeaO (DUF488 family)